MENLFQVGAMMGLSKSGIQKTQTNYLFILGFRDWGNSYCLEH